MSDSLTLHIALRFLHALRQEGAPSANLELHRKALTLARKRVALARTIERSIRILASEGVGQEVLTALSARAGDLLRSY